MKLPYQIHKRDIHFAVRDDIPRCWIDGEIQSSRWFDAYSCVIPAGERFFIETVRNFREQVADDPQLARDVAAFIGQEATHSREHLVYNARLAAQNMPIDAMSQVEEKHIKFFRRHLSPASLLAITIGLENITAVLAHQVLTHPKLFDRADPRVRDLWNWHCLEELEHKSVAFDVFTRISPNRFVRYLRRCSFMFLAGAWFCIIISYCWFKMLSIDGQISDWKGWRKSLYRLYIAPGLFTRTFFRSLLWFVPGFHPWWEDDHLMIQEMHGKYDALADPAHTEKFPVAHN
jgi:predicted metal-dependent hydrolase